MQLMNAPFKTRIAYPVSVAAGVITIAADFKPVIGHRSPGRLK
ncbi:MAG: hypothetical protein AAF515_11290 [Pseudomonadota bacterium]